MRHDPTPLPADLLRPTDDGAADHLVGMPVPSLLLPCTGPTSTGPTSTAPTSTGTDAVDLFSSSQQSRLVVFAYPRTGRPGVDPPSGWDAIPGAHGCTSEACAFRDVSEQFRALGSRSTDSRPRRPSTNRKPPPV